MGFLTFVEGLAISASNGAKWLWSPTRRKWVVAALTAALIAILIIMVRSSWAERKVLKTEVATAQAATALVTRARSADTGAITHNIQIKSAIAEKEARGLRETERVLADHQDWASQPVPDDVLRSLHE